MNCVERVKQICKERKIPISKLEKDLGFSNGYVGQLKKGSFPAERLSKIADYLSLSPQYLMYGEEPAPDPVLTSRDERDIEKILARTKEQLLSQVPFFTSIFVCIPNHYALLVFGNATKIIIYTFQFSPTYLYHFHFHILFLVLYIL